MVRLALIEYFEHHRPGSAGVEVFIVLDHDGGALSLHLTEQRARAAAEFTAGADGIDKTLLHR